MYGDLILCVQETAGLHYSMTNLVALILTFALWMDIVYKLFAERLEIIEQRRKEHSIDKRFGDALGKEIGISQLYVERPHLRQLLKQNGGLLQVFQFWQQHLQHQQLNKISERLSRSRSPRSVRTGVSSSLLQRLGATDSRPRVGVDVNGVLMRGDMPIPGAVEFLKDLMNDVGRASIFIVSWIAGQNCDSKCPHWSALRDKLLLKICPSKLIMESWMHGHVTFNREYKGNRSLNLGLPSSSMTMCRG